MIDMTDWRFVRGGGRPDLVALGLNPPPTQIDFPSVHDLLVDLAQRHDLPDRQIEPRLRAAA